MKFYVGIPKQKLIK